MKVSRGGFTLIDLIVAMCSVSFIFGIVFLLFSYGVGGYAALDNRQGVQGDALKARTQLERDFGLTHFDSIGVVERQHDGKRRDIVCMLSLSNWSDDSLFAENGLPLWDRYVVYYATSDQASGRLMRAVLAPDIPAGLTCLRITPLEMGLLAAVDQESPPSALRQLERRQVVAGIEEFQCRPDSAFQVAAVSLEGRRKSAARPGGIKQSDEGFQAVFEFDPLNTSPKL